MRATGSENVLLGRPVEKLPIAEAASVAAGEASPISDIRASGDYRRRMVEILVRRALSSACQELQMEPSGD